MELNAVLNRLYMGTSPALKALGAEFCSAPLVFPASWQDILKFCEMRDFVEFRSVIRSTGAISYANRGNPGQHDKPIAAHVELRSTLAQRADGVVS